MNENQAVETQEKQPKIDLLIRTSLFGITKKSLWNVEGKYIIYENLMNRRKPIYKVYRTPINWKPPIRNNKTKFEWVYDEVVLHFQEEGSGYGNLRMALEAALMFIKVDKKVEK